MVAARAAATWYCEPFIKTPGGKRRLADRIIGRMPPVKRYAEPFLGGGAVFFRLASEGLLAGSDLVVLGDADAELIDLYLAVQDDPDALWSRAWKIAKQIQTNGEYRHQRAIWNKGGRWASPARMLALRFAAFNGLWRVSKAGNMNTPWCKEPADSKMPPPERLQRASWALQHAQLYARDFRAYDAARFQGQPLMRPGTVVYIDSPYLGGWVSYTADGWNATDARDLVALAAKWSSQGAHIVMSHSATTEYLAILASEWPDCEYGAVDVGRPINSDGSGRGPVPELLITGHVSIE